MNTFFKGLLLTVFFALALVRTQAQNVGYIQIVHNSADPSLDTIDLYFNSANPNRIVSFVDSNVVYHAATGYITYPTDSFFTISICHKHSYGNPSNPILSITYDSNTLGSNERRAFVLSGVNSGSFVGNPDNLDTSLSIQQIAHLDSVALDTSSVYLDTAFLSVRFFQGCTDLPGIRIKFRNGGYVFSNPDSLVYDSAAQDISLRHGYYEFQVVGPDTSQNFGTYSADFSGFGGQPIIILCSGFINIDSTDSTRAFGLYALLNNGSVIPLQLESTGFLLLNNCADPAADSLDIYVDGTKAYPNLGFRNATPGLVFKAYRKYNIAIAPKNSTSVTDAIWQETFFFPRDTFFILTASGLLSQTGFLPNPSGISTAFDVLIKSPAEFDAASPSDFDFFMINGVTDAPPLNLVPNGGPYLLTNVPYADQTNYVSLPSEFYDLYVQDTSGNLLVSGFANFLAFTSESAVLLTSGFLYPADNNNGPAMGLYMVPTYGGPFIPLYSVTGIKKVEENIRLSIFPNPTSNELHVVFTLPEAEAVSLQITDVNGRLVKQVLNEQNLRGTQNLTIDVSSLNEGLYFSRLITAVGTNNSSFVVIR